MSLSAMMLAAAIVTVPAPQAGSLSIDTRDANSWVGSRIDVEAWNRPDISIDQQVIGGDQSEVRAIVRRNGDAVSITAVYEGERKSFLFGLIHQSTGKSFRWIVHVPAAVALRVRQTNGRIAAHGVRGALDLQTSNGGISVTGAGPVLDLETSNGTIDVGVQTLDGGTPQMKLSSSNGWIRMTVPHGFTTRIDAHTMNGAITNPLSNGSGPGSALVRTSNGSIEIRIGE